MNAKKKYFYDDLGGRDTPEKYLLEYIREAYIDYAESREAK